ncbi:hypothetical protein RN001_006388 [Aquatica leii]|uniref:Uncharacterized protein n=1 Tax=Aquatica leii TaxID=1421715 RepID=A0AAN7Q1P2_9COLE|nr:hypothetical protein RN001_006388 [Aquatica leii]
MLLVLVNQSYSKCDVREVKSDTVVKERYLSGGFYHYFYNYVNLYEYVVCEYETLTAGEQLDIGNRSIGNISYITFINSNVEVVYVGLFNRFTNVSSIYLNNSNVHVIEPRAFAGMENLTKLMLQGNHLNTILNWTFADLKELKSIDLSLNSLSQIQSYAFANLMKLEVLSLAYNNIAYIDDILFSSLIELKVLNISHNRLNTIKDNAFLYLNKLENATFSYNRLRQTPKFNLSHDQLQDVDLSFNELTQFDFDNISSHNLNLSNNKIDSIHWSSTKNTSNLDLSNNNIMNIVKIGKGLLKLNLTFNKLTYLESEPFQLSSELIELDLSHNKIKSFQQDTFDNLFQLRFLYLEHNQLDVVPISGFHDLSNLEILSLSYNYLNGVNFGTFRGLQSLMKLFLNNNNLSIIWESSFHMFKRLEQLNLDNNRLSFLDAEKLMSNCWALKTISLHNNAWNCNLLVEMLRIFMSKNVGIFKASSFNVPNVEGIRCTNENGSLTTASSINVNTSSNHFFNNLDAYFANSSFFNYFDNVLSDRDKKEFTSKDCSLQNKKFFLVVTVIALLCLIVILLFIGLFCICCKRNSRGYEKKIMNEFEL